MRSASLILGLAIGLCAISDVLSLTNLEFWELAKDYAKDIQEFDLDDPAAHDDDDVIALPGGPEDELDVAYLISKLDIQQQLGPAETIEQGRSQDLGWWSRRRRRHRPQPPASCSCRRDFCRCCLTHRFSVNLFIKKISFTLSVCVGIHYIPARNRFSVSFSINGHGVFSHTVNLKNGLRICRRMSVVKVCLVFYNINLQQKRLCTKLTGTIDLKVYKFRVHLKIKCFRIPVLADASLGSTDLSQIDGKSDEYSVEDESMEEDTKEYRNIDLSNVDLAELPALFKQLQIELENGNFEAAEDVVDSIDKDNPMSFQPEADIE